MKINYSSFSQYARARPAEAQLKHTERLYVNNLLREHRSSWGREMGGAQNRGLTPGLWSLRSCVAYGNNPGSPRSWSWCRLMACFLSAGEGQSWAFFVACNFCAETLCSWVNKASCAKISASSSVSPIIFFVRIIVNKQPRGQFVVTGWSVGVLWTRPNEICCMYIYQWPVKSNKWWAQA